MKNVDKNIILIGFMLSGKSTVGNLLAEISGRDFIDTDSEIEKTTGKSISSFFDSHPESDFRSIEEEIISALPLSGHIIATGGGAVESAVNRSKLISLGEVIYLRMSFETLQKRMNSVEIENRPLLRHCNIEEAKKLYETRDMLYSSIAIITVDVDNISPQEAADAVIHGLGAL